MEDSLAPNKAVLYTWAHPVGSRKLKWKCGKESGEVTQKDVCMLLLIKFGHLFMLSFAKIN